MTLFWCIAVALVGACMALLLPPLLRRPEPADNAVDGAAPALLVNLYRDQLGELDAELQSGRITPQQYAQAGDELGRRLLDDAGPAAPGRARTPSPVLAALLLAVLPSAAITLYLHLGNPMALLNADDIAAKTDGQHDLSNAQVEGMVNQLAQRLRASPDDAGGWYMLARSYAAMGRYPDAAAAYARAVALVPDDAALRADYADVLGSVNGGSLQGPAMAQIDAALRLDGEDLKALALAASAAVERGDTAAAIGYWRHLQRLLPAGSQTAARIAANLAAARGEAAGVSVAAATATATATPTMQAAAPAVAISGRVSLSTKLPRVPGADETVFIYARPVEGSRMPLAILRRTVRDLPLAFTLDDAAAMRPDHRLSSQKEVLLEARVSASGNAMPQPGDLVGRTGPVAPGQRDVAIVIDAAASAAAGKGAMP